MNVALSQFESPLGPLQLAVTERGLCALELSGDVEAMRARLLENRPAARFGGSAGVQYVTERLARYFDGELGALDELEVDVSGTPFQQKVWAALRRIPPGVTWSYRQLAIAIGRPGAVRAVGAANGQNPVAIVLPCHRVIAADGSLGGYAGGLERKAWLLRHEGVHLV